MATKKTTEKAEAVQPTAEELHDDQLELEELLADLPPMREPERLRIRHKNSLKAIGLRHADNLDALAAAREDDADVPLDVKLGLLELVADMDDFAESIAVDKEAYEAWAIANSDNVPVFVALLNKYMGALGE